jgi:CBS domain-containing protein
MLRAQQLMTHGVHCCRATDSLEQAARLMWEHDLGVVPVIDENGRAVGMLSDRDACMAAYIQGKAMSAIGVGTVMSKSLYSVRPETPLSVALEMMGEHRVRRLAVLDDENHVVGVLAMNDIIREAARERENPSREVSAVSVIASLGKISEPRYGQLARSAA